MNATRSSRQPRTGPAGRPPVRDFSPRRDRGGKARRRTRLARLDVALGIVAAIVLILATPGLAISTLVAVVVLVVCGLSALAGRAVRRRRSR